VANHRCRDSSQCRPPSPGLRRVVTGICLSFARQQRHVRVDRHGWYKPNASFCHSLQPARSDEFVQLAAAKAQQHDRLFDSVQDTLWNLRAS
jgi:hypothetical protein